TQMLSKKFPEIMKIPYKDSYGSRRKTLFEKMHSRYVNFRLNLSSKTQGLLKYPQFQADYFFIVKNRINDYQDAFLGNNFLSEVFEDVIFKDAFVKVQNKQYLFNFVQRLLFLQMFFKKGGF
ncbi:MAG: hypothetical protein K8S18_07785, partial [Desulfobacula sp.]|nr:hypothetical protein [Desulfobacula sp.]